MTHSQRRGSVTSALLLTSVLLCLAGCARPVSTGKISTEAIATTPNVRSLQLEQVVPVGDSEHFVSVNGLRHDNPLLVFVHDLPAVIQPEAEHLYSESLRRHFTLVHWHQRGAGRSFKAERADEPQSIQLLVSDLHALSEMVARWFDKRRVILVGQGFGAMVSLRAAAERPELYWAVVALAPIVDAPSALNELGAWTAREAHRRRHREAVSALEPDGTPRSAGDEISYAEFQALLGWASHFGGVVPGHDAEQWFAERTSAGYRRPPAHVRAQFAAGQAHCAASIWDELSRTDASEHLQRLEVPLFVVAGAADRLSPLAGVRRFYEQVRATHGKTLVVLEEHGHWPLLEATERVVGLLAAQVKSLALP